MTKSGLFGHIAVLNILNTLRYPIYTMSGFTAKPFGFLKKGF